MSIWTDIRDAITSPVRAVVDIATTPFEIAWDVAHGDNVWGSIKEELHDDFQATLNLATGPATVFAGSDTGRDWLRNETLNKFTLGIADDLGGYSHGIRTIGEDLTLSKDDAWSAAKLYAKVGAIVATAGVAGGGLTVAGHTVSLAEGLTAVSVGSGLARGDAVGALSAIGGPDLSGIAGAVNTVNNFLPSAPKAPLPNTPGQPAAPYVSEQASSTGGYRSLASAAEAVDSSGSTTTLVLLAGAVGVYLIAKGRKK